MSAIPFLGVLDLSPFAGSGDQRPYRVIDPDQRQLVAQVTISEDAEDRLVITQSPVEFGATVSDHAFKLPVSLRLRVGWSAAYVGGDVAQVYAEVLALQFERRPFKVYTGKRLYKDMLVAEIRESTTAQTEFTFLADISLEQVILVNTQVVPGKVAPVSTGGGGGGTGTGTGTGGTGGGTAGGTFSSADQGAGVGGTASDQKALAQKTQPVQSSGTKQTIPTSTPAPAAPGSTPTRSFLNPVGPGFGG